MDQLKQKRKWINSKKERRTLSNHHNFHSISAFKINCKQFCFQSMKTITYTNLLKEMDSLHWKLCRYRGKPSGFRVSGSSFKIDSVLVVLRISRKTNVTEQLAEFVTTVPKM